MYDKLKGEIARVKQMRKLTYDDISKITGYSSSAIAAFMCGTRETEAIATAIAKGLGIKLIE